MSIRNVNASFPSLASGGDSVSGNVQEASSAPQTRLSDSNAMQETIKKVIPAVFFQKQLDSVKGDVQKPERLAVFESQLREVVGGNTIGGRRQVDFDGSTTFSYSAGWLDVLQADDCS